MQIKYSRIDILKFKNVLENVVLIFYVINPNKKRKKIFTKNLRRFENVIPHSAIKVLEIRKSCLN